MGITTVLTALKSNRSFWVFALAICVPCAPSFSQQPESTLNAAETGQQSAVAVAQEAEQKMQPKEVYVAMNRALCAGDKTEVLKFVAPGMAEQPKAFIDSLTPKIATMVADHLKNVSILEGAEFGKLAVVVKTDTGKLFTDGLDTDPLFLLDVGGEWKAVLNEFELPSYFAKHGVAKEFQQAVAWYQENEPKLRKKLLEEIRQGKKEADVTGSR